MILDTSAVIAILNDEPERASFNIMIEKADFCRISAANYLESSLVLDAMFQSAGRIYLDRFMGIGDIVIVPFDQEQAGIARVVNRRFGKRSGHPARLNFGDCFAYALSKVTGEPLLFKGDDFRKTDVLVAI